MKNKLALNWLLQGNGTAEVIVRFTDSDIPALKAVWENTLDGREKELAKQTLQLLAIQGAAYIELQTVEYYGGNKWEKKRVLTDLKDSI